MPYYFEFDSANRILRGRLEGKITDEALKELYGLIGTYSTLIDPRASVLDPSSVTSLEVSPQTIRELANLPPAIAEFPNRVALLRRLLKSTAWRGCLSCRGRKAVRTYTWSAPSRRRGRFWASPNRNSS